MAVSSTCCLCKEQVCIVKVFSQSFFSLLLHVLQFLIRYAKKREKQFWFWKWWHLLLAWTAKLDPAQPSRKKVESMLAWPQWLAVRNRVWSGDQARLIRSENQNVIGWSGQSNRSTAVMGMELSYGTKSHKCVFSPSRVWSIFSYSYYWFIIILLLLLL